MKLLGSQVITYHEGDKIVVISYHVEIGSQVITTYRFTICHVGLLYNMVIGSQVITAFQYSIVRMLLYHITIGSQAITYHSGACS